ncbi:hypothetical protein ACHQM5_011505 [Ranunculus cassubicifolius]
MSTYYQSSSSPFELELTISSAKDLKNVNWRHGDLKSYAVVWVDQKHKYSTKVDDDGNSSPTWNETLVIPLTSRIEDSTLYIDIVHAYAAEDTKPLIGSTRISVKEIVDDVGVGEWAHRCLKLKRPSGRPQGKVEVKVKVRQTSYSAPDPYYHSPYGAPPAPTAGPYPYASAPYGYPNTSGPSGYPYNNPPLYDQGAYGGPGYGAGPGVKSKSKLGMGTGLAVGAVAGVLGGLALAEGVDYVEDKIEDDVVERVEDDLGYDNDDFGDDDF